MYYNREYGFLLFLKMSTLTFHHVLIFFSMKRLLSISNVAIPKWEMCLRAKYTLDFKDLVQKIKNTSSNFLYWLHVKMIIFWMYQFK